ncbi:MAG: MerR family transcriptional regulator [Oscillospiraceae bacterium]|nr:MerR family transcriptional regulator [Oscillospiraceae bacterium]
MNGLMKIRDVTLRYGISARALKYYEEMGLMASSRNGEYAYRQYDGVALRRLEQILILRKLNVSIKDIRRVFASPGSEVVLEVLGKKVEAIDEEVALLQELKKIILDFIRQVGRADFTDDSDVRMLYAKAREIEAQLTHADYGGNAADVNRLMEVTDKLAATPEIVRKRSRFYLIFDMGGIESVNEACDLYGKAFGAERLSEDKGEWQGREWMGVSLKVFNLDIWVQSNDRPLGGQNCCAVQFASEEGLRSAYGLLAEGGTDHSIVLDGWAPLIAMVRDRFGVHWFFYHE